MKDQYKTILIAVMFGILFWWIDSVLDYLLFYNLSFLDVLVLHVPPHELYIRIVIFCFFVFGGVLIALILTSRKQAEKKLIESQRMLATLMGNLPGMAYRCQADPDWTMNYVSEGCFALTGYQAGELLENRLVSYGEIIHDEDQKYVEDEVFEAIEQRKPFELTYRIATKNNEVKWVWERGTGIYSLDNKLLFLEGFITDVSDIIRLRDDLNIQVSHNNLIQQSAIDGFCTLDNEGRIHDLNPSFALMLGYSKEELLGSSIIHFLGKEHEDILTAHMKRVGLEGRDRCEAKLKEKNGLYVDVEIVSSAYLLKNEKYIFSVVRDITSRLKTEAYLRESEERYRLLFNHMITGVAYCKIIYDDLAHANDFLILHANPAFHRIIGKTQSIIIGLKGSELFASSDGTADDWFKNLGLSALSGVEIREERYYEGLGRWFSIVSYSPKRDHFVVLFDDITDRKTAEHKLRELNRTLDNIIQASPLAIATVDLNKCVNTWNSEAERIFGWTANEVIGKPYPLVPDSMKDHFEDYFQKLFNHPYIEHETKRKRKDGTLIDVRVNTAPIFDSDGKINGLVALLADISGQKEAEREKKRLKDQLQHAQRMEAVGQLAGGVAHDFNNLLMVIQGYSELAASRVDESDPIRKELAEISIASQRAANITKQLLAFSRKQVIRAECVDVNQTIADVEHMVKHLIPEYIHIVTHLEDDVGDIYFDRGQIEQILINLTVNARDAMPDGGEITITTQNVVLDQDEAERLGCSYGVYVCISVSDSGVGMSPEVKLRIFEPFFTTKDFGKGTGLGLSTVYGIVKQAGGGVEVESELGEGSTFKLYFPLSSKKDAPTSDQAPAPFMMKGDGTILLVEDAEAVRELTHRILSENGYKVFSVAEEKEAVNFCRLSSYPIDLLVSDIVMPHSNGFEVARGVRKIYPDVKIIFMTGYANQSLPLDVFDGRAPELLLKPFSPNQLLESVARTMNEA